jgi:hypothetical protein
MRPAEAGLLAREEWKGAAPHDPLGNAAPAELVAAGAIHSSRRMIWEERHRVVARSPQAYGPSST